MQASVEREDRRRAWDLEMLKVLLRAWGVEVPEEPERTTDEDAYTVFERWGGIVERVTVN